MAVKKIEKKTIDYKAIAIQAGITAIVFAAVNHFVSPKKGLGVPEKILVNLSLERMAQFADLVTIANVNNLRWLQENLDNIDLSDPSFYQNANKTSIANCAFVALNSNHEKYRAKCLAMVENYKKYLA